MIRALTFLAATYVVAAAQTSLCPSLGVAGVTADLLIMEAMIVVLLSSSPYCFLWAGWLGLLHDLLSTGSIGVCMFWLALTGYAIAHLRRQLFTNHSFVQVMFVLAGTCFALGGLVTTRWLLGEAHGTWRQFAVAACGAALYTGAIAWPVLAVLGWRRKADLTAR